MSKTTTIASDHVGILAVNDGIVFYLTECCRASAKGSANSPTGVCCRSCYRAVPAALGAGWMADDDAAWAAWGDAFTADALKTPGNVGNPVVEQIVGLVPTLARIGG